MHNVTRFTGKTVIVSGGAGGIGQAVVQRLASEGAAVVVADLGEQAAWAVQDLTSLAGQVVFVEHDVTEETSWSALVTSTQERSGGVHGLVNAAGVARRTLQARLSLQEWQDVLTINAAGSFLGMKYCAPAIADSGGGAIVNLSSIAGVIGLPTYTAYSASKGAVQAMTRIAAMEYAGQNVRVNAVLPGSVDTDMLVYDASCAGMTPQQFRLAMAERVPLGRVAHPREDIAPVVTFLLSEDARYLTGTEIRADGGMTAGSVN